MALRGVDAAVSESGARPEKQVGSGKKPER